MRGESTLPLLSARVNGISNKKNQNSYTRHGLITTQQKRRRINTQMNKNKHKEIIIIITHTSNGTRGASDNTKVLLIFLKKLL